MTDRSKKETLRPPPLPTMVDGPRAKAKAADVSRSPVPETPSSRKSPPAARESMDDQRTHVFDSGKFKRPGGRIHVDDGSEVNDTIVDGGAGKAPIDPAPYQQPTSIADSGNFRKEASTPIQVISMKAQSMKTPGVNRGVASDRDSPPRAIPQVKLRAMSDVKPAAPQQNLGFFAPPLDPREVRARRTRDLVIWGCLAVMIASAIAIGMWFLAR